MMATRIIPTDPRESQNSTHRELRNNIERHARDADFWHVYTNRVLALWAISVVVLSIWSAVVGISNVGAILARGSPVLLFTAWFGWCRSNYIKNERMRNLFSMLAISIEEAPTLKAKTDMVRDIQRAIVKINSGDEKRGIELLERVRRSRDYAFAGYRSDAGSAQAHKTFNS
jgi:hypothetical protein